MRIAAVFECLKNCFWSYLRCCAVFKKEREKKMWKHKPPLFGNIFMSLHVQCMQFRVLAWNAAFSSYCCEIASIWAVTKSNSLFQLEILNLCLILISLILSLGWNSEGIPGPVLRDTLQPTVCSQCSKISVRETKWEIVFAIFLLNQLFKQESNRGISTLGVWQEFIP